MPDLMRLPDWEARLAGHFDRHRETVFAWGSRDCVMFAADAVVAMTGVDLAGHARGRYDTRIGALRVLHGEGWDTLDLAADAHFARVPVGHARRGDVVMTAEGDQIGSLGICAGRLAYFVGRDGARPGLVGLPIQSWALAWRVPFGGAEG